MTLRGSSGHRSSWDCCLVMICCLVEPPGVSVGSQESCYESSCGGSEEEGGGAEECEHCHVLQVYAKLGWCGSKSRAPISLCQAILFSFMLVSISCGCLCTDVPLWSECFHWINKVFLYVYKLHDKNMEMCGFFRMFEVYKSHFIPAPFSRTDVMTGGYSLLIHCCLLCIQHYCS